ncbi:MAG: SRPBCC family protein [Cyanobacteria bacterium P01_E01_bin.34]
MPDPHQPNNMVTDITNIDPLTSCLEDTANEDIADDSELLPIDGEDVDGGDVDVTIQKLDGRRRCLEACIDIPDTSQLVWDVLTDYEGLSEFIPNLVESCIVGEQDGCTLLRQVGTQKFSFLKFSAAVTLKMETIPTERIDFTMLEGDFIEFFGCWQLSDVGDTTRLSYAITILPPRKMPIQIVQRRLRSDLASNLVAIQQEVARRSAA